MSGQKPRYGGYRRGRTPRRGSGDFSRQSFSTSQSGQRQRSDQHPVEPYNGGKHFPSKRVKSVEDSIIDARDDVLGLGSLSLGEEKPLARRPGYGIDGNHVDLWANYFEITGLDDLTLHQHTVEIKSGARKPRKGMMQMLFSMLLNSPNLTDEKIATNYFDKLICSQPLGRQTITLNGPPDEAGSPTCNPQENSPGEELDGAIQALNIVLAHYPNDRRDIVAVGQSKHFNLKARSQDIGDGLIALGGFFHSVRPSTARLLLNVNVSAGAFNSDKALIDFVKGVDPTGNSFLDGRVAARLHNSLKGLKVMVTYPQQQSMEETVFGLARYDGLAQKPAQLECYEGGLTVEEYFKQVCNRKLLQNQIVVNVANNQHWCYIPAQFCTVISGQTAKKRLSGRQSTGMIRFACRTPGDNAKDIVENGLRVLGFNVSTDDEGPTRKFGIQFPSNLLAIDGRVLRRPSLRYSSIFEPEDGFWNIRDCSFFDPVCIQNSGGIRFGYLVVYGPHDNRWDGGIFREKFEQAMFSCGMAISPIKWQTGNIVFGGDVARGEQNLNSTLQDMKKAAVRLTIVVLPTNDANLYSRIKYMADIKHGIHTICIVNKPKMNILSNPTAVYLANLALKTNLKLGGVNHKLDLPGAQSQALMGNTMYIGIDVTHPTRSGSEADAPSTAGVVANSDQDLGQWPASIRRQKGRQELVEGLAEMVTERLRAWRGEKPPEKIVVYRDGVSESQYKQVLNDEYPKIVEGVATFFQKEPNPKLTIIIVGKRHDTRFYPATTKQISTNGNVCPGTIVDRGCTMVRGFDFFLVAHQSIQGTSRPARYVVLRDENKYTADQIQEMTHNLCYVFGRATRSVSIATPAYYADIVCERARCYLYDMFNTPRHGAGSTGDDSGWARGVHPDLIESMFYI